MKPQIVTLKKPVGPLEGPGPKFPIQPPGPGAGPLHPPIGEAIGSPMSWPVHPIREIVRLGPTIVLGITVALLNEITWLTDRDGLFKWLKEIIMFRETDPGYSLRPVFIRGDGGTTIREIIRV
jgi:hypothetical protein